MNRHIVAVYALRFRPARAALEAAPLRFRPALAALEATTLRPRGVLVLARRSPPILPASVPVSDITFASSAGLDSSEGFSSVGIASIADSISFISCSFLLSRSRITR